MKKRKKGISDNALAKITGAGLMIGSLGGLFSLYGANTKHAELDALEDKASPDQLQELQKIQEAENETGYGAGAIILGKHSWRQSD